MRRALCKRRRTMRRTMRGAQRGALIRTSCGYPGVGTFGHIHPSPSDRPRLCGKFPRYASWDVITHGDDPHELLEIKVLLQHVGETLDPLTTCRGKRNSRQSEPLVSR